MTPALSANELLARLNEVADSHEIEAKHAESDPREEPSGKARSPGPGGDP